jgi:hypothetical protein
MTDGLHTFTVNGVDMGANQVRVRSFYGNVTVGSTSNNAAGLYTTTNIFSDLTGNEDSITCVRVIYGNLTINSGINFTPPGRTRGFIVFVKGTVTNNGTISMTGRGSSAPSLSNNLVIWGSQSIPTTGQAGRNTNILTASATSAQNGAAPTGALPSRGTGGGGSGGARKAGTTSTISTGGAGSAGTMWSGGAGGGAVNGNATVTAGSATGTTGGNANQSYVSSGPSSAVQISGGAGVTTGQSARNATNSLVTTFEIGLATGTGGILVLMALGNITNSGSIQANGVPADSTGFVTGGSSGGGSVNILCNNALATTNITASGGAAATPSESGTVASGGPGGAGSVTAPSTLAGLTLPRRTLFNVGGMLYFRNFTAGTWVSAGNAGSETPFVQNGMLDGEVYALDKTVIAGLYGANNLSVVNVQVYQP